MTQVREGAAVTARDWQPALRLPVGGRRDQGGVEKSVATEDSGGSVQAGAVERQQQHR